MSPTATPRLYRVASRTLAAGALLLLFACAWRLCTAREFHEAMWLELTIAVIAGGYVALGWLRPTHVGITAPQTMLLLGAAGMVAGLAWDSRAGGLNALLSVCQAGAGDFVRTMRLHWQMLPATHIGMVLGGLATVPLLRSLRHGCRRQFCARLVQNLACSVWMILGMSAGSLAFLDLAARVAGRGAPAMVGGMFAGMVWGMVASVCLYRVWFAALALRKLHVRDQGPIGVR